MTTRNARYRRQLKKIQHGFSEALNALKAAHQRVTNLKTLLARSRATCIEFDRRSAQSVGCISSDMNDLLYLTDDLGAVAWQLEHADTIIGSRAPCVL